jgi:flagellar L-ring protein precursor FlgH
MKTFRTILLFCIICIPIIGCEVLQQSRIKDEPFIIDNSYRTARTGSVNAHPGSLWKGASTSNTLFHDQRAGFVGDIITIKIVEVSQASEKASTGTNRSNNMEAGISNLMGLETSMFPSSVTPAKMIGASTKNDFSGSGETTRTGSLSATITARIIDILPNGNLAVEGKRELYVNNEKKEILVQGIVRQKDVAYDNSIYSTQIADAKIIYTGIGVVGEKQSPGWLARIVDRVWPF